MPNDVPISSLLRVERGLAAPEELAALAVVVACYAGRTAPAREAAKATWKGAGGRRAVLPDAGCWAGCWTCR